MKRILERANQILDLDVRAEDKAFSRLAEIEGAAFVNAVREKVSIARGAANNRAIPNFRLEWQRTTIGQKNE